MKRCICFIMMVLLMFSLFACVADQQEIEKPVSFYYRTDPISYASETGVIASETRESAEYEQDLPGLLDLYLQGPLTEDLRSPFPADVTVVNLTAADDHLEITLSSQFSKLTGLNLTVACACLSRTALELTEYKAVSIRAENALLDGSSTITMTLDSLLLLDKSSDQAVEQS